MAEHTTAMSNRPGFSLKVKAISFIALIILAVGGILSWRFLAQSEEILTNGLKNRALAYGNNLARSSRYGILTEDRELLHEAVEGALQEDSVLYVRINNAQGAILAEGLKHSDPRQSESLAFRKITDFVGPGSGPRITHHSHSNIGIYRTFVPVETIRRADDRLSSELALLGGDTALSADTGPSVIRQGSVQILMSSEKAIAEIRRTLFHGVLLTLAIVGIAVVIAYFGVGYVIKQLRAIGTAATKISSGDLSQRVPVRSSDEIGQLASAFNNMTSSLSSMTDAQQRRVAELSALHDIGVQMSSTLDPERLTGITLDGIVQRLQYDRAIFFRYDYQKNVLADGCVADVSSDTSTLALEEIEIPLDDRGGICAQVALRGEPVLIQDVEQARARMYGPVAHAMNVRSLVAAPVKFEDRILGVLVVEAFAKELVEADLKLVVTLCSQLAVAMANTQSYREIETLNQSLEEKVASRTAELQLQQDRLKDVNDRLMLATRHKSEFLARMSHELRTPLNAIIGYSEMLIEEHSDEQSMLVQDLGKIHSSGKHLLSLINDVLDLSKVEAGRMELYVETLDIAALISDVQMTARPVVEKNGNRFVVDCSRSFEIRTDVTKLRQILLNLLSNAGKFTEHGTVSLSVAEQQVSAARWLVFSVRDTGIGMNPQALSNLFQEFSQADVSTSRKYGGTGLGLAISKHFCEMMGGYIEVKSEQGEGTEFILRLPAELQPPSEQNPEAVGDSESAATRPQCTVLVIDNDASSREIISRFLSKDGFNTVVAEDGERGLKLARQLHPTAVTLDILMPGMDGWKILGEMKADPELADIPVIVASILDEKDMGFSLGAADYLTKPIERERLLALIRRYCSDTPPGSVMIVEDDDNARTMISRIVTQDGWDVIEAINGQLALHRLRSMTELPRIILLDLMMPVMDGLQFLEELRLHHAWKSIPVVVLTAKILSEEERRRLQANVHKVIEKSRLSSSALLKEMKAVIGGVCTVTGSHAQPGANVAGSPAAKEG